MSGVSHHSGQTVRKCGYTQSGCLMRFERKLCMVDNGRHKFCRCNNNNNVNKTTLLYWLKPELHEVILIRGLITDDCHVFSPVVLAVTKGPLQQVIHATSAMLKRKGSTRQDKGKSSYHLKQQFPLSVSSQCVSLFLQRGGFVPRELVD